MALAAALAKKKAELTHPEEICISDYENGVLVKRKVESIFHDDEGEEIERNPDPIPAALDPIPAKILEGLYLG